jgi:hypothetical protein
VRELLEKLNKKELLDFIVEYAENDAKLANAINVSFGKPEFKAELSKMENEIAKALDGVSDYRNHDRWGNANIYVGDITEEIKQRAEQGHIRLAFAQVETLYRKLLENLEYQGECEISDEAEYCLDIMSKIADKAALPEDKEYTRERCIELSKLEDGKNYGLDHEDKLLGIAAKFGAL